MARGVDWEALARQLGGTLSPGTDWRSPTLRVSHRGFAMHADVRLVQAGHPGDGGGVGNHELDRTAMVRTPFRSLDGFRFVTRRRDMLDRLVEPLRLFRPRVQDPRLRDARYFSTNDRSKLRDLLGGKPDGYREPGGASESLSTLLAGMPDVVLEVRQPAYWSTAERQAFPENVRELSAHRLDADPSPISELLDLTRAALTLLEAAGSAAPL